MDLSMNTNYNENKNIWEVSVTGEIDIFNSQEFKTTLLDLLEQKEINIKVDCDTLTYIDSTGLSSLVAVLKRTKKYGGEISLCNVKPTLYKLFKITNLDKVFLIEGEKK